MNCALQKIQFPCQHSFQLMKSDINRKGMTNRKNLERVNIVLQPLEFGLDKSSDQMIN